MIRDVLTLSYSGNIIVNSAYSLNLDNGTFVFDGSGVQMGIDGSSNSAGTNLDISSNSLSCYGSAIKNLTLTAVVECQGNTLTGTIGGAHVIMPITLKTSFGKGTFTLPPNTPGGASFSLPVANMPAAAKSTAAAKGGKKTAKKAAKKSAKKAGAKKAGAKKGGR